MLSQRTIPKQRPADPALDHEALFARGLEQVRLMAHRLWTDHNVHDPGITTLELLSYALTDLAYRASFPVQDLLASETDNAARTKAQFHTARQILPVRPLTLLDYRKLLIDLRGVKNAWVRPTTQTYYADTARGELLRTRPVGVPGIVEVNLRGLYEVLIELMDGVGAEAGREIVKAARATLHANRGLCEDFVRFGTVQEQEFVVCAELELAPDADVARVHAEILFGVQQYFSPPVSQYTLDEMLERRKPDGSAYTADEIFDGPALEHGFIPDDELEDAELRTEVRLSDVVSVIMDVEGVRAVREIVLNPYPSRTPPPDRWRIPVRDGRKPVLNQEKSRLVFYKRNMPFVARKQDVDARLDVLEAAAAARESVALRYDFDVPVGRYRDPGAYYSFQNHFPAVYGVGEAGLPGEADERRRALAYQLKGYLLFFDQLMADFAAQMGGVRDLFSTDPAVRRTYFHQAVDTFPDHEKIYGVADVVQTIQERVEDPAALVDRRNRFLDHLIARYAEQFREFAEIMRSEFGFGAEGMVRYKCEFLRDYPRVSSERALAYDYSLTADAALWNSGNVSGLERRLGKLLGIRRTDRRNLGSIAYDVYAEVDGTPADDFRFRIRHRDTGKILLSSSTRYPRPQLARDAMRRAVHYASDPAMYQRKRVPDGRHYFNLVDDAGEVIARRIEYFRTEAAMEAAIEGLVDYVRDNYTDEGMFLVESILLRPEQPDDPFLRICPDPNCTDCGDEDPYSYRIHVILPAFARRFEDMDFRRWAEQVVREETPAHIQPKVCWIGRDDMASLEKLYRDWIYLRSGRETARRKETLEAFTKKLFDVKSVYPVQRLRECGPGSEGEKFVLGQTALGSQE